MATQSHSAPPVLPPGKSMLDAVMYVATLASKSSEIDPQLDRVRAITSKRTADQLTKDDNHELLEVYDYLETYLVKHEKLRSFTQDSIRQKLNNYLQGKGKATLVRPLSAIWAIAIGSALMSAVLPESIMSNTVKVTLAMVCFLASIHLGAAWMFWTGLRNFKDKIRQAYLPICLGIIFLGATLLQVPFAIALDVDRSQWFIYIASSITVPIAGILFYIGMRRFALIGGVKSVLLSRKTVLGLCIGAIILINITPRLSEVPFLTLAISLTFLMLGVMLSAITAIITAKVRQVLSSAYRSPMTWFMVSLLISTFACAQFMVLQMITANEEAYNPAGISIIVLFVSAFVILQAGISFRKIDMHTH